MHLHPSDWITIFYLGVTGALIAARRRHVPAWTWHLLARTTIIASILALVAASTPPGGGLTMLRDWYPFATMAAFYWELRALTSLVRPRCLDAEAMKWEERLFGGQPSRSLSERLPWPLFSELLHVCYASYYVIAVALPLLFYVSGKVQLFDETVFAEVLICNVCFLAFVFMPVAGPRYETPPIASALRRGPFYRLAHAVVSRGSSRGTAFPSLHAALTLVVLVYGFRHNSAAFFLLLPLGTGLVVGAVYGRFHYAVDMLAGLAVGAVVAAVAPGLYAWLR